MSDEIEKIPVDARLLSDAIIELNISRRSISVYPRGHPSVERSLSRAFSFLQKLFELKSEITLGVAKDTLIIGDYFLDRKNPVYREFALHLNKMNIAYVTFIAGLTKEELYEFHRFISDKISDSSVDAVQEAFTERNIMHIKAGFIDYRAFSFEEGKTSKETADMQLWERYIHGLLEGTLQTEDISEEINKIPPDVLAKFLNKTISDDTKEEAYDKVITSYIKRTSEAVFSGNDLKRLLEFINGLRPELKKQFLSSTVRVVSKDIESAYKSLSAMSVDEVVELLSGINEQNLVIPDALKNLLDKLSDLPHNGTANRILDEHLLIDDIFLSSDIVNLLRDAHFKAFIDDAYQQEIQKLLGFKPTEIISARPKELGEEYSDECIDKDFSQIILELIVSDILSEEEYKSFIAITKEQTDQFIWTGKYGQVLKIMRVLEANTEKNRFSDLTSETLQGYHSQEFILKLVDSFRIFGREMREEAWLLCEYYGDRIILPLINALVNDDSQTVRRFLMGILTQLGNMIIPEVIKRLGDNRWFVKRNMLYILGELNSGEVLPHVRPYCRHENLKVGFEAIKCLLNFGDQYGIETIKDHLFSESREAVEQAITLSGAFRIREVVPDLIQMLKKRGITGADLYDKIPIVNALGNIGDSRALDALRGLLSEKSILFRGAAERLKEEVYKSLKNYPYKDIQDLIEAGLKSRNEYIKAESLRLTKAEAK